MRPREDPWGAPRCSATTWSQKPLRGALGTGHHGEWEGNRGRGGDLRKVTWNKLKCSGGLAAAWEGGSSQDVQDEARSPQGFGRRRGAWVWWSRGPTSLSGTHDLWQGSKQVEHWEGTSLAGGHRRGWSRGDKWEVPRAQWAEGDQSRSPESSPKRLLHNDKKPGESGMAEGRRPKKDGLGDPKTRITGEVEEEETTGQSKNNHSMPREGVGSHHQSRL